MKAKLMIENRRDCKSLSALLRRAGCSLGVGLLFCAAMFHPNAAFALGTRIPNQDAAAIARGNAFVATADDPSAIYYNPAGITQLDGVNAQFGAQLISINSTYQAPTGGSFNSKFGVQPVPEFYLTDTLKDYPLSFGLGMYAPYGLALEWPDNVPFKTAGMEASLTYVTLNPVVAWKICDKLSIAVGPTINVAQIFFRNALSFDPNGKFQFRGDDHAFGYTGGVLWQPLEEWSFGANYHSATKMNFSGTSSATGFGGSPTTADFPFAQFVMGGISFRPTTNWNFEADIDWTDWHSLKTVDLNNTPFGTVPFPFNWKSSFMIGLGGTRYLDNGYFVSAGYFYSQNSTTTGSFNPLIPDTNLHVGSVGFGHKGEHWSWTLAGQLITGPDRVVSGDTAFPSADGTYHWMNGSVEFSIGYHF